MALFLGFFYTMSHMAHGSTKVRIDMINSWVVFFCNMWLTMYGLAYTTYIGQYYRYRKCTLIPIENFPPSQTEKAKKPTPLKNYRRRFKKKGKNQHIYTCDVFMIFVSIVFVLFLFMIVFLDDVEWLGESARCFCSVFVHDSYLDFYNKNTYSLCSKV